MYFGDGSFDGVLFESLEDLFNIATCTRLRLSHVRSGAEDLALRSIGLGSHASQFLLNHAELVQELAKGFTLGCVGCPQFQRVTCTAHCARSQFQASNIKDIEGNFIALMQLT